MSFEDQIRQMLGGQLPPRSAHGGVRMLLKCGECGRIWEMDGSHATLDLSPERISEIASELHADLAALPGATCRLCGLKHHIGEIQIDGYPGPDHKAIGYGISWESVTSDGRPAHVLFTVHQLAAMEAFRRRGQMPHSGIISDYANCRAWLAWAQKLRYPTAGFQRMMRPDSDSVARHNRPGFGMTGSENYIWQGGSWTTSCPPLGGHSLVTAMMALPDTEQLQMSNLISVVQMLAGTLIAGRISGEPRDEEEENPL